MEVPGTRLGNDIAEKRTRRTAQGSRRGGSGGGQASRGRWPLRWGKQAPRGGQTVRPLPTNSLLPFAWFQAASQFTSVLFKRCFG